MRVLLMNQFFWPDNAATSQLLTDLAQDLVKGGHSVEVICGGGYINHEVHASLDDIPAVVIHRVRGMAFSRTLTGRISSYATFYLGALWRSMRTQRFDVVLTLTTPPLLSVLGALLKVVRGTRFCIWEMDVYPDVAVDLGYIRAGSLMDKLVGSVADWSRRQADSIIVLGDCMRDRIVKRGIDPEKIAVVHNWADSTRIVVSPRKDIGNNTFQVTYSGNLGLAHDTETVLGAIGMLKGDDRFRFLFIGGGVRRGELLDAIARQGLTSVELRAYVARENLSDSLGLGDIGLVTQREDCCGSVVPSKVYGLLAAGRPILYVGPGRATPARIVRDFNCGWHVQLGDSVALKGLLEHLAGHPEEVIEAGSNARAALVAHFDRPIGTSYIIDQLLGDVSTVKAPLNSAAYSPSPRARGNS